MSKVKMFVAPSFKLAEHGAALIPEFTAAEFRRSPVICDETGLNKLRGLRGIDALVYIIKSPRPFYGFAGYRKLVLQAEILATNQDLAIEYLMLE